jgi:16S rRNA G966 N2-methylase RsmD
VGIEQSSRACAVIRQNWQQVATAKQVFQLIQGDVLKRLPSLKGQQFDRIYFDPPYASPLYQPVLSLIAEHCLLAAAGEMAVEYSPLYWSETALNQLAIATPPLQTSRHKHYGNTALWFVKSVC